MHKFSFFSSFKASDRFIISIAIMLVSYDERVYIKNKRDFTTGVTIRCVFGSPNGLDNAWLKMSIFTEKSSFLTKLIFTSVAM